MRRGKLVMKIRTDRKSTILFLLCLENRYNIEMCKIHETQQEHKNQNKQKQY